jgi:lipopolysaccharide/colanic/teichoic acid biosynthesis glycosyltransferase
MISLATPRANNIVRRLPQILVTQLWHGFGLVVLVATGILFVGLLGPNINWNWVPDTNNLSVYGVALAYLVAVWITGRMMTFSGKGALSIAVANAGLVFLVLLALVAISRVPYSRTYILLSFGFSVLWIWVASRWLTQYRPRFALVPGGMAVEAPKLDEVDWLTLERPTWQYPFDAIVADLHELRSPEWARFVAEASLRRIPVFHIASVYEQVTGRLSLNHSNEQVWDTIRLPPLYPMFKRVLDVAGTLLALPFALPVMALVALIIRRNSPGPVLFWQERVGLGGQPFRLVKFRTMHLDSEKGGPKFAQVGDSRIIPMGNFLRKFRLDELPQLWNILKGEMSLIGPRPEQVKFSEQFSEQFPLYAYRHMVRPGLTGWAQTMQGYASNDLQTQVKLTFDLFYVKHLSVWLDLLIVCRTVMTILTGFGAR